MVGNEFDAVSFIGFKFCFSTLLSLQQDKVLLPTLVANRYTGYWSCDVPPLWDVLSTLHSVGQWAIAWAPLGGEILAFIEGWPYLRRSAFV